MRSPTLTDLFVLLARARTTAHRHAVLINAVQNSRFDEDQQRELRALLQESASQREAAHALRPSTNPVQDCADLTPITAGPIPLTRDGVWGECAEWLADWNRADDLTLNKIPLPGPLLLSGPTGSGKTMLTHAIAGEIKGRPAVCLDAHRVLDSHMGETGNRLAKAFAACAKSGAVLVLEEIDGFAETRNGSDGSGSTRENNRITIALMRLIESATFPVIATTNRPEILDPALLRRFEFRVTVPPLEAAQRRVVLQKLLGFEPTGELLELPIHESVLRVNRLRRRTFLDTKAA